MSKLPKNENMEWLKRQKSLVKEIKKFEAKGDRIQITTQLSYMHNAINLSSMGWTNWINGWISLELSKKINIKDSYTVQLTDAELKELHNNFKEIAMAYLELDIKFTEIVNKKLGKKTLEKYSEEVNNNFKRMVV